jgi:hypothetical protein
MMRGVRRGCSSPPEEDAAMEGIVGIALVVLSALIIIGVVRVVGRDASA